MQISQMVFKSAQVLMLCGAVSLTHAADLKSYTNPVPLDGDVAVPMPCGLEMVFRKVYTANAPQRMADKVFTAGAQQTDNPLSEAVNESHLQGSFHDSQCYYYLMGKYEVTALQYQALMTHGDEAKCPKPKPPLKRPQNLISWFDAMEAARQLSLYLSASPDGPKEKGVKAFARLPTDSEYEYALRGGAAVDAAQFAAPLFFTDGTLGDYAWHQSPQSANGKLNAVGKLKANPLGIFDLYGNVQEMTQDLFAATRLGRLHGQSGGFTVRGGSYLTAPAAMTAALRVEKPFYTVKGSEFKAEDTGMRFVLALPVITDAKALEELTSEVKELGYESDDKQGKLLSQLDDIIGENKELDAQKADLTARVGELNSALGRLRQDLVSLNAERDEQRSRAIVSGLRLGGFLCSNTADYWYKLEQGKATEAKLKAQIEKLGADNKMAALPQKLLQNVQAKYSDDKPVFDLYAAYLSSHAADLAATYDIKQLKGQLGNAQLSAGGGQGEAKSQLPKFIAAFVDLLSYQQEHSAQSLQQRQQYFVDKCYALYPQQSKE